MKTRNIKIYSLLLGLVLALFACQPDEFNLGSVLSKSDLQYSITQSANDPNMVILESQTPGVTPLWITPMGRSTKINDTLLIPFPGDYKFVYGVQSAGGLVQADTFLLSITTTNLDYVNDILWTYLSGGVGNSKTWISDNGKYGLASGPLSYADPAGTVEYNNFTPNWEPSLPSGSTDENIGWGSTMTFSLAGGAYMTTDKVNEGGIQESGTYFLNASAHTLSTTDATILRPDNFVDNSDNWNTNLKILTLTENQLQIAVFRNTSDEDDWWYILNYVWKEYADNYEYAEPEPSLPDGWEDDVTTVVSRKIKWVLSKETPFNWANLDGSLMNAWSSVADYPDWTGFNASVPDTYTDFSLTMNAEDNSVVFVAPDGTTEEGTYTLDEKGIYTFDGVTPAFNICSWVNLYTTADNQWRILSIEKNLVGDTKGMWVGARDPSNPQYSAFHLIPQLGGGDNNGPEPTVVNFDNTKLAFGNLETSNPKYRIELYNAFGSTFSNPPLDPAAVLFENKITITFTIQGMTFVSGAAGSYQTALQIADSSWSPSYWGDGTGSGETTITGDGTYTVSWIPGSVFETAQVFCIDIVDLVPDLADIDAVTVTVDEIVIE